MQLQSLTEILELDNYKVHSIVFNNGNTLKLYIDRIEEKVPICSWCGEKHSKIHSTDTVIVEDLPILGKRVFLVVPKRKIFCDNTYSIRVEEINWIHGRFTKRFAENVYRLTSIATNQEAGWFLGLDDEKVYRIDLAILEEKAAQKLEPVPTAINMSVDEVAWKKGHKYVTNVIDIDKRKVIWNTRDRGKEELSGYYKAIGPEACKKIKSVAMDGARGFIEATKEYAKNALIVYDKFHINQKLNDAINDVRIKELEEALKRDDKELKELICRGERWLLLKNKYLTNHSQGKLDRILELNKNIAIAKILKDQFLLIYKSKNTDEAKEVLETWIYDAKESGLKPFVKLSQSFTDKKESILNYFKIKMTSAISEGFNNKIKRLKRMAYGYRNIDYFLLKIHQHCGLLSPRHST